MDNSKAQRVSTWTCQLCGTPCSRPPTRGQVPKWCDPCRRRTPARIKARTCHECGVTYVGIGDKFCSSKCFSASQRDLHAQTKRAPAPPRDPRGPLRKAYEEGDWEIVASELSLRAKKTVDGCHEWQGSIKSGYPVLNIGKRQVSAHRIAVEARHGALLGSQPVHHVCANTICVNPDHLMPVTHRDNIAEMLARKAYLERIAELEAALRAAQPDHPLLAVLPLY